MATLGNNTVISGSLIGTGSGKIMQVPHWDWNQVFIGSYPPNGSLMQIDNLPGGPANGLYYSTGTAFYQVDVTT
jgi:hypothetical protein